MRALLVVFSFLFACGASRGPASTTAERADAVAPPDDGSEPSPEAQALGPFGDDA